MNEARFKTLNEALKTKASFPNQMKNSIATILSSGLISEIMKEIIIY